MLGGFKNNVYFCAIFPDKEEYMAEAVQDWFNVNAEMPHADGKHN